MTLFGKGKGAAGGQGKAPVFRPIDRGGLLGLLDQVVNGGQSGVLELREPRGEWVYAFQSGALTHASGGRVRGARQAFDLLWEFQSGEFIFTPGVNPNLAGNLYIDKGRLLDLLRRSQAMLLGPSAPYIPPGQQRPIQPVTRPYQPPSPGQMPPTWQPGPPPGAAPAWQPSAQPPAPGWPPAPQPGYPQQSPHPGAPAPAPGYPPQGYPPQPYPQQPYAPFPPPAPPMGQPGVPSGMPPQAPGQPANPMMPPEPMGQPPMAPRAPIPRRPATPPSFSVPPMPIPRKREAIPSFQPPAPAPAAPPVGDPAKAAPPTDDLAALRASLVAQAPKARPAPTGPAWGVRTAEGAVAPPPAAAAGKGKNKGKVKRESKLNAAVKLQLIKFLLWACERKYSPDDHWTLKDAFEVSTMELRDQFIGAFSQIATKSKNSRVEDDDVDDVAAGRMRGRARRR